MKKILFLFLVFTAHLAHADLVLYTDRPIEMLQPALDRFEEVQGEKVYALKMSYGDLINRLAQEGENSPADVIFVKDMVYLHDLVQKKLLKPMEVKIQDELVAPAMKHPEGLWTAVTIRPRTLVYSSERVKPSEVSTYEDLATEKWGGRLCLRTSNSSYNQALVSSLVSFHGYDKAQVILEGWMHNLAADPFRNDRAVLDAIAQGTCDVGVVNSYYLAGKLAQDKNYPVSIAFANQDGRGVHVNGSGAGVARFAKNVKTANTFIEFLLTEEVQLSFSAAHLDYPARVGLLPQTLVQDWGVFQADTQVWSEVTNYVEDAKVLFDQVGYE